MKQHDAGQHAVNIYHLITHKGYPSSYFAKFYFVYHTGTDFFQSSHPSNYLIGSLLLNFGDLAGTSETVETKQFF